jgi:ABC-type uncharacterized transport system substrate-binding protein
VGVILQGGTFDAMLDGLRDGLRQLGVVKGKELVLEIRDTQGDLKAVEEAARSLEKHQVDLIFTAAASVTVAANRAHVQRILAGTNPRELPVEGTDRVALAVNLKTAKQLGLKIPQIVLFRADTVIE